MFVFQVNFSNSFLKGISPQFLFRRESLWKRETEIRDLVARGDHVLSWGVYFLIGG